MDATKSEEMRARKPGESLEPWRANIHGRVVVARGTWAQFVLGEAVS